jgi:exopolysaccharide biosynthesis polyprenyl glycosylphosphotransferase
MLREHDRKLRALLLLMDIGLCAGIFALIALLPGIGETPSAAAPIGWQILVLWLTASLALPLSVRGIETQPSTRLQSLLAAARQLVIAAAITGVTLAAVAFAIAVPIAPVELFACLLAQVAAVGLLRLSALGGLQVLRRSGRNYRNVLVIGTGPRAIALTETIERHPEWGLRLLGYVDEGDVPFDGRIPSERVFKMIDFPRLIRDEVIDEVITACPRTMLAAIGPAVEACSAAGVPLTVMTDLFGDYLPPPRLRRFGSYGGLSFAPVHHNRGQLLVKRGIDIAGALAGLVVAAPVIGLAALAIRLTSPGPILFRQIRCGLHGRPFAMIKLRTMVADAEERQKDVLYLNEMGGPVFKIEKDPRVTPVGRWLRAFSIDELPQLWNILAGDMSLVGPRPPIPAEVAQYETSERRRLSMRPGLTCLWQVSGRNQLAFDEWVKLDLQYIDGWSLTNDLKIMFLTVPVVLGGGGS